MTDEEAAARLKLSKAFPTYVNRWNVEVMPDGTIRFCRGMDKRRCERDGCDWEYHR